MRLHSAMFTGIFAADERVKKALTARAKVVKKSHMRKGYAIFSCKVYGVKYRGGLTFCLERG